MHLIFMLKGKQYSRKKVKDQSPEPCIDARRLLSEKSGNISIRKSLILDKNYSDRPCLMCLG